MRCIRYHISNIFYHGLCVLYTLYMYLPPPAPGASRGEIVILAEEVQDSKYTIAMQLSASHLDKKDFFGKVDCKFSNYKCYVYTTMMLLYIMCMFMLVDLSLSNSIEKTHNLRIYNIDNSPRVTMRV